MIFFTDNTSELPEESTDKRKHKKIQEDPFATTEYSSIASESEAHKPKVNTYGEVKTQRWHRPKPKIDLKEMEKVPTRRSQRISEIEKSKKEKVCY